KVGDLVLEQAVAVVGRQAIDVLLVGRDRSERGQEILARQGEALATVMRRADNYKQGSRGLLGDLLEPPGKRVPAAVVVDMGNESGPELIVGRLLSGQAGAARVSEKTGHLAAQAVRVAFIAAQAARPADVRCQALAEARAFEEQAVVQSGGQGG